MTILDETTTSDDPVEEVNDWLTDNWDPDLTVGEWWERLGMAGWSNPLLPVDGYGRGLSRGDALRVQRAIAAHGALAAPAGLGLMLAAPTIATHGTREQIDRFIPDIVTGRIAWCQLFSEPGAGSDLAGLNARAIADGDEWVVNGQKVWTSGGHLADLGMLLARTDPDAPKHQGISWFALPMHQPGVEVRPLKEMTGHTMFSEVFMTDAIVADSDRIGDPNNGWAVANTTLLYERGGMGAGGDRPARGAQMARAGTVAGDLGKRVGDFVAPPRSPVPSAQPKSKGSSAGAFIELARDAGRLGDPVVRQQIVQLHIYGELTRLNTERHKAVRAAGADIPGIANLSKLLMAHAVRARRDIGLELLGARGMLHGYTKADAKALIASDEGTGPTAITIQALSAQALPIYGGTDQIQRNIIGERVLGLPKEPGDSANVPFSELRKNG